MDDIEPNQSKIDCFYAKCNLAGFSVFLHSKIINDINRDSDSKRKALRLLAVNKYPLLFDVRYSSEVKKKIGLPHEGSNDYVDYHLLTAVYVNAVNILVSNDINLHKRAKALDISDKVYFLDDVDVLFQSLEIDPVKLPPNVYIEKCYNINLSDEIFDSLRNDYRGFNEWFKQKCQNGHRSCYIIRSDNAIDGIAIFKTEDEQNEISRYNMSGKILKICTFKTAKRVSGNKFGELLLRSIFDFSYLNNSEWIYITAFEKNYVCAFFENFGFEKNNVLKQETGERVYIKRLYGVTPDIFTKMLSMLQKEFEVLHRNGGNLPN
jgi:hypothetical protein